MSRLEIPFVPRMLQSVGTEGLPGVLGNKGTLAKYRREQGNMSLLLGKRGTKFYKLEDENTVSKFNIRGTNKETCGNIGQFWKETRQQGPPHRRPSKLAGSARS